MPKKSAWGNNPKAAEARERKANEKQSQNEKKQKAIEDEFWKDDNKQEQKKLARKEADQRKKQEALLRKQDAKKLLEEEEAKLSTISAKAPVAKVTRTDIEKAKEKERKHLAELAELREKEKNQLTVNPVMEEENPNRKMAETLKAEGGFEARNVEDAISVLSLGGGGTITPSEMHPEKRMKAAYTEFEERELPRLKEENPGLRLSQLKQILRKEWQKSPDNPFNQK